MASLTENDIDSMVWREIKTDALQMSREESELFPDMGASELLSGFLESSVLQWHSLEEALASLLASKLSLDSAPNHRWHAVLLTAFTKGSSSNKTSIQSLIKQDLMAIQERDPACPSLGHAFLFFKGFHGIEVHRVANWLWWTGRKSLASLLQSRASEVFGMDIHPAAWLGSGIMIDHATGVVIGETARVGNGCTLLHGVTLGGNGKQKGDRHPKLGANVLVGAGASILGNITVGEGAKIGASAVVLSNIPSFSTAVGCPAKVVGRVKVQSPAAALGHTSKTVKVLNQRCGAPYRLTNSSNPDAYNFADQLQNVCGIDVPDNDAIPLLFEQRQITPSSRFQQKSDERKVLYKALACGVCST
eukprot:c29578_g1_i1 orf=112-1194(-)